MIIKGLEFVDTKSDKYMFGGFQYIGHSITNSSENSYLIYSSKSNVKSMEQLKLKMIHEIYPGHHYMNRCFSAKSHNNLYEMTRINSYIKEGWAKYCEFYYANQLDCSKKMKECFNCSLILMSIMFVVAIDIHYKEEKLINIHNHLIGKCGLTKNNINSMILSLNVDIDRALSYYLGYKYFCNYVRNKQENEPINTIIKQILDNPMI